MSGNDSRFAGDRCYVIAEAGSNHDRDISRAFELIDVAADAGADAVKFQLFTAAGLYPSNCGYVDIAGATVDFYKVLQSAELPEHWLPELAQRCGGRGIDFLCSAFDEATTRTVAAAGVPVFKVASPEITHHPLLALTASYGQPVILSTGMSSLGDIEESIAVLEANGALDIALLQCVTAYPCPPEDSNLNVIQTLASAFGMPTGLSDHTTDPVAAPITAYALGGRIVEKHFTISRQLEGPDHAFAIEPDELHAMVRAVRSLEAISPPDRLAAAEDRVGSATVAGLRGRREKRVSPSEAALAACDRRALHATAAIQAGEVLGPHNIGVLRGERNLRPGLHPRYIGVVEGARAVRPIDYGAGIAWADLLEFSRVMEPA